MNKTRVKVCCISSVAEAQLAIKYGADAIGLVGEMPSGPGIISDDLIHKISYATPSTIDTFLLTSEIESHKIIAHHKRVNTSSIQLVDHIPEDQYVLIHSELPTTKLVQVIHVLDENSIQQAIRASQYVDTILLDSGNPNLKVKELGGTGKTHNWKISREITKKISIPVFLAGGLHEGNVQRAIEIVNPYGVDLCNGVRSEGKLDEVKLNAFFKAVNG